MILLAIDTSSPLLSVALKKDNEAILEKSVDGFLNHAENLMSVIVGLLKRKRLRIQDVDAFLVDLGPGSFTGLRIGLATLKGFLAINKKKCYGALSLDLISENARANGNTPSPLSSPPRGRGQGEGVRWLVVALDARREKIYFRLYKRGKERWIPFRKPQTVSLDELKKLLPEHTAITGDALLRYHNLFETEMHDKRINLLPQETWYPKASTLISLFLNKDPRLVPLKKPSDFLPLYFRLSEAEEKRKDHAHAH